MNTLKHLFVFIVLGGALFSGERLLDESDLTNTPTADENIIFLSQQALQQLRENYVAQTGQVPDAPTFEQAVQLHIDNEILLKEAIRIGIPQEDPVVMHRIAMNLKFLEQDIDAQALLDQAWVSDMVKFDLVIRRRLIERMEKIIALQYATPITDAELQRYLQQNADQYAQGPRYLILHAFFARKTHSSAQVNALYQRWQNGDVSDTALRALANDTYVNQQQTLSERSLRRLFGPVLANDIASLSEGSALPVRETETGYHFVKLLQQQASTMPALAHIRTRVEQDFEKVRYKQAREQAFLQLRSSYKIERAG